MNSALKIQEALNATQLTQLEPDTKTSKIKIDLEMAQPFIDPKTGMLKQ